MVFISSTLQQDLKTINDKLKQFCEKNPQNYIKDPGVVKCKLLYDVACWKEILAGQTAVQPCPFLLFSTKDNISRRCDKEGNWQEMNITKCHRLTPKEAADKGRKASNTPTKKQDDSLTHAQRVQRLYIALSWIEFFVLLPVFILICIVMGRENDRFILHNHLILAFILRIITLFIYHYGKMGETDSNTAVCNAFWLLNRYFAASEITWMLNEGVFLLRMLAYPFDSESYLWYYYVFGWGFSGFLTFCVYLPYMQFKISRVFSSCWVRHSQSEHMLVLYVPLSIMLLINCGVAVYVIRMLTKKLKNSHSSPMNAIKKSSKALVVLVSLLGVIYLLVFYQPGNNPSYDYFVAIAYPFQGIMVCIFCVFLSAEFREALKRRWMKWRYGILIETNPYSANAGNEEEPGPSYEPERARSTTRTESSVELPPRALSIASLRQPTSDQLPDEHPRKQSTERSLLSRSSDLTKFRLAKVEPEPVVPVRIQSAGPRDWCPPTLQAVKAWAKVESSEKPDTTDQGHSNEGFFGSKVSLCSNVSRDPPKPAATEVVGSNALLSQNELKSETKDSEEPEQTDQPDDATQGDPTKVSTPQQTEDQFLVTSNQEFDNDDATQDDPTKVSTPQQTEDEFLVTSSQEFDNDSLASMALPEMGLALESEMLTARVGASVSQDAQPSTGNEELNDSVQGMTFWSRARQLASRRRRSRIEHNKVISTEGGSLEFHSSHADRFKQAEEYRLAWISSILQGNKTREDESDV
ncbi:parathyroid hormone/parathyroid hormone-related peptide receptor-like isoform X1 [Pocillopora damicornis]|nr:parathyroid hormone/parathyroid hormone-related peptide receptor-like isoform X1 [Pocillopora damicornis]